MSTTKTEEIVNAACKNDCYEIIYHEFDYARETASQAMEDRHKMVNFYLILTGAVLAGAVTLISQNENDLFGLQCKIFASVLLLLLFFAGFFYVLKLAFLRIAWYDSVLAMNKIKDFFIDRDKDIAEAFRWSTDSLKNKIKLGGFCTVFFLSAFLIILLDSLALMAAIYFIGLKVWWLNILSLLIALSSQVCIYILYIKIKKEKYDRQN